MANRDRSIDLRRLGAFSVTETSDPTELDTRSKISNRLPEPSRTYRYRLRDRALFGMSFKGPICSLASRQSGSIVASYGADRFAMEVSMDGDERNPVIFTTMLQGRMSLARSREEVTCCESQGLVFRTEPDIRLLTSDNNVRASVFLKADELEAALEHMIDDRLRKRLEFARVVDWTGGLAASAKFQIDFIMDEFERIDGVTSSATAMATLTDLLISLILRGVPHNYMDRLVVGAGTATPGYIRRAEEFMRTHAAEPIRMVDVANSAGCSVRTLGSVFRRFRSTTPLHALHIIRLECVRNELSRGIADTSVGTVARRYGFTNAARFTNAYRRHFGDVPAATSRGSGRISPGLPTLYQAS